MSDDLESLWRTIDVHLRHVDAIEREHNRKVLIRRLRHFGVVGAHPESTPAIAAAFDGAKSRAMPRLDSPLCLCGDPRRSHDEDGACRACHCPMYANEDSL